MVRKSPCQYCKQRRRKCERDNDLEPCKRCFRAMRECILPSDSNSEEEFILDNHNGVSNCELSIIYDQVKELENQCALLEQSIIQERSAMKKREPQWTINKINGELRLTTDIKSLEELMQFGQSAIRYLSPFGNTFQSISIKFNQIHPSLLKSAMNMINKIRHKNISFTPTKSVIHRFSNNIMNITNPNLVINLLIDNFFSCLNEAMPLLHEPSYRDHLNSIKDPMKDPITLAICVTSAVSRCKHSIFNSNEKRYFGEYFYQHCVNILLEIFDDPSRSLESLLVINVLQVFLLTTIRFNESLRWAGIAVVLSRNLRTENEGYSSGGPHLPLETRIKYAAIHRNSIVAEAIFAILEFVMHKKDDEVKQNHQITMDILPDESRRSKENLEMFNYLFNLSLHPAFAKVINQAKRITAGDSAELCLEDIIAYENTLNIWWNNLPEHLKICPEPFNLTQETIDHTSNNRKLIIVCIVHMVSLNIQGFLIQAKSSENSENISDIIKSKAMHMALKLTGTCLALIKRLQEVEDRNCYSPNNVLIHAIDSLTVMLQLNTNNSQVNEVLDKLNEYMLELRKSTLPDHQVKSTTSPLSMVSIASPESIPTINELYESYPLPAEALLFDLVQSVVEQSKIKVQHNI